MKNIFYLPAFSIIAALFLYSCSSVTGSSDSKDKAADTVAEKDTFILVELADTRIATVSVDYDFTATVQANIVNRISPSMPVRIDRIFVEIGDYVKAGTKLVQMDESSLVQAETQFKNIEIEFNRIDELYKVGGVSKSAWDAANTNLQISTTSLKNLKENTQLVSPVSGIVTARNYDNGDMYAGGQPVLVVEQISPVKLLIHVSESHYTKVKKGMQADVKLDVYGDEIFAGTVSLIHPSIDPNTRTFTVEVKLANQDSRVRPGMSANIRLNFGSSESVVVPDMAVVKQPGTGDRYVYVYSNGKAVYRKVELGRRLDTEYEVLAGLGGNEKVIVGGQNRLNDGSIVKEQK